RDQLLLEGAQRNPAEHGDDHGDEGDERAIAQAELGEQVHGRLPQTRWATAPNTTDAAHREPSGTRLSVFQPFRLTDATDAAAVVGADRCGIRQCSPPKS